MGTTRAWLDGDGRFIFGKYGRQGSNLGRLVEMVAREDPDYLRWIVEQVEDITEGDREVISAHLNRY